MMEYLSLNELIEIVELSPYDEGYEDYYIGFEPIDCPYEAETPEYHQWIEGWYAGCSENEDILATW